MRRLIVVLVAALGILAITCKEEQLHVIDLQFRETSAGLSGFDCTGARLSLGRGGVIGALGNGGLKSPPLPLAASALPACGGTGKVCIVVDVLLIPEAVRCDSTSILEWCDAHPCTPALPLRHTFERTVDGAPESAARALADAVKSLESEVLLPSVPDESAILRVVAVEGACSSLPPDATLPCDGLLGCAMSCPTALRTYSGPLRLDLDLGVAGEAARPTFCEIGVNVCSRVPLKSKGTCPPDGPTHVCADR